MRQSELAELDRAIGALSDPTRRRILLDFYVHGAEWTVDDVAKAVGVHRTVAHDHLERLLSLGYLAAGQRRGRSGKPAKLYRLAGQQIDFSYPVRRFARLAGLLAEAMDRSGDPGIRDAREAGRRYGATLATKPADSVKAVLKQLAPLGADYAVSDEDVLARNCIFREACAIAGAVVCELHAGLLEGAFQQAGLRLRTKPFRDYAAQGCRYRLLTA